MEDLIQDWKNRRTGSKKTHKKLIEKLKRQKLKQLDQLADSLHDDVFSQVDCLECANCCSSIPPMLNRADVSRIAKHLGMKPAEFRADYLVDDEDGDTVMKTTPCTFLLEDNTCFIYEFRPKACREYPHTDNLEFSQHFKLHATNSKHCPAVFHILERMAEEFS